MIKGWLKCSYLYIIRFLMKQDTLIEIEIQNRVGMEGRKGMGIDGRTGSDLLVGAHVFMLPTPLSFSRSLSLSSVLQETLLAHSHLLLRESISRQIALLLRALLAKELSAVATVVSPVGGGEF